MANFTKTETVFVEWANECLVDLAATVAGVELEYGDVAEYEGGYELEISAAPADLTAFWVAYNKLNAED